VFFGLRKKQKFWQLPKPDEATKLVRARFKESSAENGGCGQPPVAIHSFAHNWVGFFSSSALALRGEPYNQYTPKHFPQAIRGLMGFGVFFDLYTIYHG